MWQTFARIADINVEFQTKFSMRDICWEFFADFKEPDLKIIVTEDEIVEEMMAIEESQRSIPSYYENIRMFRNLCKEIWKFDALIFHAATVRVDNRGIAFAANSGTGKTTHLKLWQELLGDKLQIVNGDKPIIRFIDDKPIAFGTPWRGKESYGGNLSVPLTDICLIERDITNSVEKISIEDGLSVILGQTILPDDTTGKIITLQLIDKLVKNCNFWRIKCNMEPEAAEVAYNTILDI